MSEQTKMSLDLQVCQESPKSAPGRTENMGIRKRLKWIFKAFFKSKKTTSRKCCVCYEEIRPNKLVTAPCEHEYCHRCLQKLALFSLRHRMRFPVRCCDEMIPLNQILPTLSTRTKRLYASRVDEESVPPAERWYCPHTSCRQWIHTKYLKPESKYQKCPRCRTVICSQCRDLAHSDRACVEDPGLGEVLRVAQRCHWQRCYNCHTMVEKVGGCHHVRCTCGAEFCYGCGRAFPGCRCRESDDVDINNDNAIVMADGQDLDCALFYVAMDQNEGANQELEVPPGIETGGRLTWVDVAEAAH